MGEVLVDVRLINGVDDAEFRRGSLPADRMRTYESTATVDTGAARTVIPAAIAARLGMTARTQQTVELADGRIERVGITGPLIVEIQGRDTVDEAIILGDQILIGQTVLEKLDLLVDCNRQRVIPNPKHPNGPVTRV